MLRAYARFLSRWPWVVVLGVLVGVTACTVPAFLFAEWPDFSQDTVKGFETRGTSIAGTIKAVQHLSKAVQSSKLFYSPPSDLFVVSPSDTDSSGDGSAGKDVTETTYNKDSSTQGPEGSSTEPYSASYTSAVDSIEPVTESGSYLYETSDQPIPPVVNATRHRTKRMASICAFDWIGTYIYPKIVFEAKSGHNLLSAEAIKQICHIDDVYTRYYSRFNTYDCPSHSLGFYISLLSSKHCQDITDNDVEELINLLRDCAVPYSQGLLTEGCHQSNSCGNEAPAKCQQYNAVLYIFEYLTDREFFDSVKNSRSKAEVQLAYTSMFVSRVYADDILHLFEESLEGAVKRDWSTVAIAGIDIGDYKYNLFEKYLMEDIWYFALAAILLVVVMVLYLCSLAITIATLLNVGFSFLLAYFIYHIVCRFTFFPFINLLSFLVLLGVGADDVFIFVDVWCREMQKADPHTELDLTDHLHRTLKHALLTIFVTSLTTSAAFFSNAISNITAVRCFAIFSGIAIIANFLFMVTWFPAVLVMVEWLNQHIPCSTAACKDWKWFNKMCWLLYLPGRGLSIAFDKILPFLINRLWFVWLVLLTALGVAGLVLVFYKPKLSLPSSGTFQLFHDDHPIERFDMELAQRFRYTDKGESFGDAGMRAAYIWGIKNVDNGNHVDPDSLGHMVYDDSFDLSTPEAQVWMKNHCENIRKNASFLSKHSRDDECLMSFFERAVGYPCSLLPPAYQNYSDCCERQFPLPSALFKKCFLAIGLLFEQFFTTQPMDYPLFDRDGNIRVYLIDFWTNHSYSNSFQVMGDYSDSLNNFLDNGLETAPRELKHAWVFSDLGFYDLQRALSSGTYIAFAMSLGVALLVIQLTSLNLILSLYAVVNIGFSIAVTVGFLVLLGWKLNILESITLSLAIGLSIDFSIHYGVAYRLCDSSSQSERVTFALSRVGPAIVMATLTTFLAGAAIMGTRILAYTQLGTFLMIVMVVSWVFATFFFLPLCSVAGPKGNYAQISCPPKACKSPQPTVATVSENTKF